MKSPGRCCAIYVTGYGIGRENGWVRSSDSLLPLLQAPIRLVLTEPTLYTEPEATRLAKELEADNRQVTACVFRLRPI